MEECFKIKLMSLMTYKKSKVAQPIYKTQLNAFSANENKILNKYRASTNCFSIAHKSALKNFHLIRTKNQPFQLSLMKFWKKEGLGPLDQKFYKVQIIAKRKING